MSISRLLILLVPLLELLIWVHAGHGSPNLNFGPPYAITGNFLRPYGLAIDNTNGRLLVADTTNHRFKWTSIANLKGTYAFSDHGYVANRNDPDALTDPQAIAVDASGNVYVVNTLAGNVKLYTWNGGNYLLDTNFCNTNPHIVNGVDILMPRDIAIGPNGEVYLLDSGNNRILKADGPTDTSWNVFKSDSSWGNPYGLTVDGAGVLYLADTDNHRIIKIVGNTITSFGRWGTGRGEFRYPRDVEVDQHGRIFVADTFNHRVQVLTSTGQHLISLGHAPGMSSIEKVVVDSSDRVFVVDSDNNHVLAFLEAGAPVPFDPFLRDYLGDPGTEPSSSAYILSSPDILVRHNPDVDLAAAATSGLESYAFQQPRYGELNYIYLAVRNKGTQTATDNFAKLFWYDPGTLGKFPEDWNNSGFYTAYSDSSHNTPGTTLSVPSIPANGVTVVGPLLWRPPSPDSAIAGDGIFRLGVRVINPFDYPPVGDSTTMVRDSNNVVERRVIIVRGPFPTGDQDTLMVRVNYPDIATTTGTQIVAARANDLTAWIQEISWGEADVKVLHRGPVVLPHNRSHYMDPSNNLLIEMTQDVLNSLLTNEPNLLDGTGPGREIGRVILVTNDLPTSKDWATTGSWPYSIGGKKRYLSVSIQTGNDLAPLFAHGFSHQLNLEDLYPHENVTFPRPYVDGWDNMAKPMTGAHPLVESKELAAWVTSHNAKILFVPRPAPGTTWNNAGNPIQLWYQKTAAAGQIVGVAFGLTNGVTSFTDETVFYYVEARMNSLPEAGADSVLPQTGVLMYYVNTRIPQGQGRIILRDHGQGGILNDAAIPVGGSESPGGTGIVMTVQSGTGGADYNLAVQYSPPVTDYDVYMRPGNPSFKSPDILADNQKNGYVTVANQEDGGDKAIAGEENRLIARAFNAGPADAYDVEVAFFLSEPWHTVGDKDSFDEFKSVFIDKIENGKTNSAYVTWTPATGVNPHTCVRVELRRLFNDKNAANNNAQRNVEIDHSVHGSPYTPVEFKFQVRNEEPFARPIYFRADGVPKDWTWSITPDKVYLSPGASATGTLKLQPPLNAPDCTSHQTYVTSWVPRGDTLIRLGGVAVQVDMQKKTEISLNLDLASCPDSDSKILTHRPADQQCLLLRATGCTNPSQPNQDIVLRYEGPDGKPIYHTVRTDGNGCFEDFLVVVEGGYWGATADLPATICLAPAKTDATVQVPLPQIDRPESDLPDAEKRLCVRGLSKDVVGVIESSKPKEAGGGDCQTTSFDQVLRLKVASNGRLGNDDDQPLDGEIEILDLRNLMTGSKDHAGLHRGRFRWKGQGLEAVGWVAGLTNVGTHHTPASPHCAEGGTVPGHWELSLNGTIVEGAIAGARLRAVVTLDLKGPNATVTGIGAFLKGITRLQGALEGVIERDCLISESALKRRVRHAREEVLLPPDVPCAGELPCLARIAKKGKGKLVLDQIGRQGCAELSCGVYKTWSRLEVPLKGNPSFEGSKPVLADGLLTVNSFIQVLESEGGRGEHGGTFLFLSRDGVRVEGEMLGITRGGTHRSPSALDCETADLENHLEGRLVGNVLDGPQKGLPVEARYLIQLDERTRRYQTFLMTLDGWQVKGCLVATEKRQEEEPKLSPIQPPKTPPKVQPERILELPDDVFRPLKELPREAVERFKQAEGGRLTKEGELQLRTSDRRFRELDVNKNGSLKATAFMPLYQPVVPTTQPKRSIRSLGGDIPRSYLSRFDKNRDAIISRAEAGSEWKTLALLDKNKDGRLSVAELRKTPEMLASKEFTGVDRNEDGKIDFTEFALWWRTLPALISQ